MDLPEPLVDATWLRGALEHHGPPDLVVADVRWYPTRPRRDGYLEGHIRGAVYLDVDDDLSAPARPDRRGGRHPLPSPEAFAAAMSRAGIGDTTAVVVYDHAGGSTAARLWWMLHVLGHPVAVLDGGLQAWSEPLERGEGPLREPGSELATFTPKPWPPAATVDATQVERLRDLPNAVLVDVRAPERYRGEVEPIDAVAGHIPGARNVPWTDLLDQGTKRFLTPARLRERYANDGATRPDVTVIAQCGSGVTACHALLAFELAGIPDAKLYVGSWSDWISDPSRPVATGLFPAGEAGVAAGAGAAGPPLTADGSATR
jgi:thiosulfate/3-mercaptopyruvate sulfurtransferase